MIGSASVLGTGTTVSVEQGILAFSYDTDVPASGITWGAGSFLGAANGATVTVNLGTVTNPAFSLSPDAGSFINLVAPSAITFANNITGAGHRFENRSRIAETVGSQFRTYCGAGR